jgi:hypothetical protein
MLNERATISRICNVGSYIVTSYLSLCGKLEHEASEEM